MGVARTRADVEIVPPLLKPGQARCPACRNGAGITSETRLRSHSDLFGTPCGNRVRSLEWAPIEAPPVHLPPPAVGEAAQRVRRARQEPSRIDAGSICQGPGCGKWLPGERKLCGRCYATGNRP